MLITKSLSCISVALVNLTTAVLVFLKLKLAKNIWRGLAAVQKACRLWICGFLPHFFPRWEKGILQQPPAAAAGAPPADDHIKPVFQGAGVIEYAHFRGTSPLPHALQLSLQDSVYYSCRAGVGVCNSGAFFLRVVLV
jgi:hypothetical protein